MEKESSYNHASFACVINLTKSKLKPRKSTFEFKTNTNICDLFEKKEISYNTLCLYNKNIEKSKFKPRKSKFRLEYLTFFGKKNKKNDNRQLEKCQ